MLTCRITVGNPWILIAFFIFAVAYFLIQLMYRRTSIEIQRIEANTRAPVISHFSESLSGIGVVRAYRAEKRFLEKNLQLLDLHSR